MYKLNPDLPLVWRTPTSLQCGVNTVACVLEDLTPAQERLLSALQAGISEFSLPFIARESGLSLAAAREFLTRVEPAFVDRKVPPRVRIALDGSGPCIDQLGNLLVSSGHRVVAATAQSAGQTDIAVLVGNFAIAPHRTGAWLRRGTPHFTVCWGDTHVSISPLFGLTPGSGADVSQFPCAECLELHRRDDCALWPTIASQVVDLDASSLTALTLREVTALISRWITTPAIMALTSDTGIRLNATTGEKEKVTYALHPDCACQALPRNVSVLGSRRGRFPVAPTTVKDSS